MGNCQASEAATVIIQLPGNKIQRIYWSVTANEIMNSNPGHYVALLVPSPSPHNNGLPLKHLKLLRPDDTLLIGHLYRLVSFEDVLKEFASKKCVKLLKERRSEIISSTPINSKSDHNCTLGQKVEQGISTTTTTTTTAVGGGRIGGVGRSLGHWKPALQSISEIGS